MALSTGRLAAGPPKNNALLVALADALAGALGSVVAVVAFYPIDIAKTRAQALYGGEAGSDGRISGGPAGRRRGFPLRSRALSALMSLVRKEGPLRLYEGIEAKALQSLMGSFVYFYAYAFIKGAMRRHAGGGQLRPSLNLLAAALAGAVNQAFTLPLENITTRMQTSSAAPRAAIPSSRTPEGESAAAGTTAENSRESISENDGAGTGKGTGEGGGTEGSRRLEQTRKDEKADESEGSHRQGEGLQEMEASTQEGIGEHSRDRARDYLDNSGTAQQQQNESQSEARGHQREQNGRQSLWTVARELYREDGRGVSRFWRGFAPSLILTCNPAINYTAFDLLKALWLRRRASRVRTLRSGRQAGNGFLNPVEAFFIAAAAKSLATLITYPLIRAKVILMTSSSLSSSSLSSALTRNPSFSEDEAYGLALQEERRDEGHGRRRQGGLRQMGRVMIDIVRHDGIGGLYAGCGAQLLHTILKSALLLATKEEIARAASSAVSLRGRGAGAATAITKPLEPIPARGGSKVTQRGPIPPAPLIPPASR